MTAYGGMAVQNVRWQPTLPAYDEIMRVSQDNMYPRQISVSWDILRISPSWDNPGLSSSASLTPTADLPSATVVRQYSVFVRYFQKTFILVLPCVPDPVQYFRIISDMRSSYGTRIERADARRGAQMKQRRDEGFVRAELDDTHLS